jgi:hypothetical protein
LQLSLPCRVGLLRALAVAAALAVPLFAVGSAQAALTGASPSVTSARPDLRSATVTGVGTINLCFDRAVAQTSPLFSSQYYSDVAAVGYGTSGNDEENNGSQVYQYLYPEGVQYEPSSPQCIQLSFDTDGGALDLNQYTAVEIAPAVLDQATSGDPNLEDSVTLSSSSSHAGTRGLTTGPDLIGSVPNSPAASNDSSGTGTTFNITYTFDQAIDPNTVNGTGFWFEDAAGSFCYSTSAAVQYNSAGLATDVVASFDSAKYGASGEPPSPTGCEAGNNTGNAKYVGALGDAVYSAPGYAGAASTHASSSDPNQLQGQDAPGSFGTAIASLTPGSGSASTALMSNHYQVSFQFDHTIAPDSTGDYFVVLSDGTVLQADGVSGGNNPDQVIADFSNAEEVAWNNSGYYEGVGETVNLANVSEYAVQAAVGPYAAYTGTSSKYTTGGECYWDGGLNSNCENSPGSVPIGGNTGALSRGYTTGADVYSNSIVQVGGNYVLEMYVDQRVRYFNYDVTLLNANGDSISGGAVTISAGFPSNPENPELLTANLTSAQVAQSPTQAQYPYCVFETAVTSGDDGCSLGQVVELTSGSSHLRGIDLTRKGHRAHKAHKAHKGHRAHRARRNHKRS